MLQILHSNTLFISDWLQLPHRNRCIHDYRTRCVLQLIHQDTQFGTCINWWFRPPTWQLRSFSAANSALRPWRVLCNSSKLESLCCVRSAFCCCSLVCSSLNGCVLCAPPVAPSERHSSYKDTAVTDITLTILTTLCSMKQHFETAFRCSFQQVFHKRHFWLVLYEQSKPAEFAEMDTTNQEDSQ